MKGSELTTVIPAKVEIKVLMCFRGNVAVASSCNCAISSQLNYGVSTYLCTLQTLLNVIYDQSIASTKTKYIKLNTKTQFLKITFNFCIHFKRENFFFSFCFLVKCIKKSSNFHLNDKKYFGF